MSTLISVPAGRCIRRSLTEKWVDPQPEKGLIELKFEDDLMHLWWKSRPAGTIEDELIIFPGEATFEKVTQDPTGRTHILKFSSSDQRYFFWFQRASRDGDARAMVDINALLQDPTYRSRWEDGAQSILFSVGSAPLPSAEATDLANLPSTPAQPAAERSWPPTPGAPRLSHPEPLPPSNSARAVPITPVPGPSSGPSLTQGAAPEVTAAGSELGKEEMARLLVEWAKSGGVAASQDEDARLTDVLSPANISTLLATHPSLTSTLAPLLPAELDLPPNPSAQDLMPILSAPQFTDAIASLDSALRSGGLPGSMMRELGLGEEAGRGVKEFLEGLRGLYKDGAASGAGDEKMDED